MMANSAIQMLIFFLALVIGTILTLFFSYKIFKASKDATKGWKYLIIFAIFISLFSIFGVVIRFVGEDYAIKSIIFIFQAAFLLISAWASIYATMTFTKDLGFESIPRRYLIAFLGSILLILIIANYRDVSGHFGAILYASSCLVTAISLGLAGYHSSKIVKSTKGLPWIFMFVGFLLAALALAGVVLSNGCCAMNSDYTGSCDNQIQGMGKILPVSCNDFLVGLYWPALWSLVIADWSFVVAYFLFCKYFFKLF